MGKCVQGKGKITMQHRSIRSFSITSVTLTIAVAVLLVLIAGSSAIGKGDIETTLSIPASIKATATANNCENSPGPFITITGELTLEGIDGMLIFRNNRKGTHEREEEVTVDVTILEPGETIRFAKQPPEGGVGGNPLIFIQLLDGSMNPISEEIFLGRCVQGLNNTISSSFDLPAVASASFTTGQCQNNPGPFITLSGELIFGGINGKLIFKNNRRGTHSREEAIEVDFVILQPGETIQFAKQPPLGGVGGNPLIYFQFTNPWTEELFLGRCVQLSK